MGVASNFAGKIGSWRNGALPKFLAFLFLTMAGSALAGGVAAGVIAALRHGYAELLLIVPANVVVASCFLIPICIVLFGLPSGLAFALVYRLTGRWPGQLYRIRFAGILTTALAAIGFVTITWPSIDIAHVPMTIAGMAVVISPFTAARAFRDWCA